MNTTPPLCIYKKFVQTEEDSKDRSNFDSDFKKHYLQIKHHLCVLITTPHRPRKIPKRSPLWSFREDVVKGKERIETLLPFVPSLQYFLGTKKVWKKRKVRILLKQYLGDICLYLLNECIYKRYTLLDFFSLLSFRKESNQRRRIGAGVSIPPPLWTPCPQHDQRFSTFGIFLGLCKLFINAWRGCL